MKDRGTISNCNSNTGCQSSQDIQKIQPFPSGGILAENLNSSLDKLISTVQKSQNRAYSYVVKTVKLDHERTEFEQHGSAPNFQGDVFTLCTCKHQMRSSQSVKDWLGVWIAGVTSRTIHDGRHWLFYLAKIESASESHSDLWMNMRAGSREAKAAHSHFLGDIFKPKTPPPTGASDARFSPMRYISPTNHAHRWRDENGWHDGWHNDINYRFSNKYSHPPLLVAEPQRTFIWNKPMIYFDSDHCRNYRKWSSIQELLALLRGPER